MLWEGVKSIGPDFFRGTQQQDNRQRAQTETEEVPSDVRKNIFTVMGRECWNSPEGLWSLFL